MTTEKILLEFDPEVSNLLPVLKKISAGFGYVDEIAAQKTADYFSAPLAKIYETASFYDLIKTKKQPAVVIQVCSGANCAVKSSYKIIREIENQLHIKAGDEFHAYRQAGNPKIKLEIISCLGQCGSGPVMVVNGNVFTKATPSNVDDILRGYL